MGLWTGLVRGLPRKRGAAGEKRRVAYAKLYFPSPRSEVRTGGVLGPSGLDRLAPAFERGL